MGVSVGILSDAYQGKRTKKQPSPPVVSPDPVPPDAPPVEPAPDAPPPPPSGEDTRTLADLQAEQVVLTSRITLGWDKLEELEVKIQRYKEQLTRQGIPFAQDAGYQVLEKRCAAWFTAWHQLVEQSESNEIIITRLSPADATICETLFKARKRKSTDGDSPKKKIPDFPESLRPLVAWVLALSPDQLPPVPFDLAPNEKVTGAAVFLKALQAEARKAPAGPRIGNGGLHDTILALQLLMPDANAVQGDCISTTDRLSSSTEAEKLPVKESPSDETTQPPLDPTGTRDDQPPQDQAADQIPGAA